MKFKKKKKKNPSRNLYRTYIISGALPKPDEFVCCVFIWLPIAAFDNESFQFKRISKNNRKQQYCKSGN